jgi:hypothetical protein
MRVPLILSSAVLLSAACATSSKSAEPAPVEVKSTGVPGEAAAATSEHETVTVKAVDVATRSLTIEAKDGQTETITVAPEVKRLGELAPGDTITVQLKKGLLLQVQPAGSKAIAPQAVIAGGRAGAEAPPGGVAVGGLQATVTVLAIDAKARLVTLQGPNGNQYQVKAGPELALEKLKVGDRMLATYVETLAIDVEKAAK